MLDRFQDARAKTLSRLVARSFAQIGEGTRFHSPIRIKGAAGITLGRDVEIGSGCLIGTYAPGARLLIGDGSAFTGTSTVTAAAEVIIGRDVLVGRNVHIFDHEHGRSDPVRPIMHQPLERVAPVRIGDGAWLGHGVVILPGVVIGEGAIVGALSLVRDDIPAYHVAVGSPARVIGPR